ncbi:MAG: nitroreductase family protein [Candidatus Moeniiplasma glomeromycotorum]|nr:nitroreductase family protein [Candidatus Moeniiplasma glomeromycotorum]MCE8167172.1 nitroreductase family protein [Candidatus Moeniiplasma glomeromycotorum]MCE8168816.1 nitroreductase family protein [Candidatus Moeniiplasma glomeromycotorum]
MVNRVGVDKKFQLLTQIISQRKAIRHYQKKLIPRLLVEKVIKVACRAPSWYGLEPWFIVAVENEKIKQELFPFINSQKQVLECSHLFLILSYSGQQFHWGTDFCIQQFKEKFFYRLGLEEDAFPAWLKKIQSSIPLFTPSNQTEISHWSKQQCFILLQNFLLLFTSLGIATSPMGGFQEKEVINYLEKKQIILPERYHCAVIFAAGYPVSEKEWDKESLLSPQWKKVFKILL